MVDLWRAGEPDYGTAQDRNREEFVRLLRGIRNSNNRSLILMLYLTCLGCVVIVIVVS